MSVKLVAIFSGATAAVGLVAGSIAGAAFGLPLSDVGVAGVAAGAGAGVTSALSQAFCSAAFDGKGPSAGFAGMIAFAASHVTLVPAGTIIAARCALQAFN